MQEHNFINVLAQRKCNKHTCIVCVFPILYRTRHCQMSENSVRMRSRVNENRTKRKHSFKVYQ